MQIINPSIKLLQTEIHFELTYHSNGSDALFGNMLVQNYGYFLAYESEIDFMVLIIEDYYLDMANILCLLQLIRFKNRRGVYKENREERLYKRVKPDTNESSKLL